MLCKINNNKAPPFYFVLLDFSQTFLFLLPLMCVLKLSAIHVSQSNVGLFVVAHLLWRKTRPNPKKIFFSPRWFNKSQLSVRQVNWLSVFVLMTLTPYVYIRRNRPLLAGWFCRKNWKITCVMWKIRRAYQLVSTMKQFTHIMHMWSFFLHCHCPSTYFFSCADKFYDNYHLCTLLSVFDVMYVSFASMLSALFFLHISISMIIPRPIFLQILNKMFLFYTYIVQMSVCCLTIL